MSGTQHPQVTSNRLGKRASLALVLLLALAATTFSWLSGTPAGPANADANIPQGRLFSVMSPAGDALVMGPRMRVQLALKRNVSLKSAQLNGKRITKLFTSRRSGTRQQAILLPARFGKRFPYGRNFLSFVVRRGKEGKRDFEEVAFTRVRRTRGLIRSLNVRFSRSRGAEVTLVPSTEIARFKVTLNGRNVSKLFRQGTPLKRRAALGGSDGLKHGANRLVVTAHTHHGQYQQLRRTFKVNKSQSIAGAGRDRVALAGEQILLNPTGTLKPRAANGKPLPGGLEYQWQLSDRPAGSDAALHDPGARKPVILTDLPGTYTVKLTTRQEGANGSASSDTVSVIADSQPQPAISTFANEDGKNGIRVDVTRECEDPEMLAKPPCFYPNPGSDGDLQVVVLDRRTLEMQSNQSYPSGDLSGFATAMERFAVPQQGGCPAYDTSKLVLLAMRSEPGSFDKTNFAKGFSIFNVRAVAGSGANDKVGCPIADYEPGAFPFSVIAVPGTLKDRPWTNEGLEIDGAEVTGEEGSLDGFLKRASDDPALPAASRSFTFPTAVPYDTRRPGPGGRTEFVIGTASVPVVPIEMPATTEGLGVFSFDPVNPEATLQREAFVSHAVDATTGLDWTQLDSVLKSIALGKKGIGIVSNASIGGFPSEPRSASFPSVLETLESQFAANADTFARAVNQANGRGTYSMIAVPPVDGVGGAVYQSSSAMARDVPDFPGVPADSLAVNAGRLTGTIQRANDARVFPSDGNVTGADVGSGMLPVVYAAEQDWQLTPDAGATVGSCQEAAFAYIATQFDGLFPGGVPVLWQNPNTAACAGRDHTGTGGVRRADNLDSNNCAAVDPPANGVIGAGVREASMALRSAYQSISTTFSEAQVEGTVRPADAPFTEEDLNCAKRQMIDELAARQQVMVFMDILKKPQQNLQGRVVVDFAQIAENVKTAALARYTDQLKNPDVPPSNFWANFAFRAVGAVGTIGAFFAPAQSVVLSAFKFLSTASSAGQSIFNALDRPAGNPVEVTNQYLLLASELDRKAAEIEVQMQQTLAAQQNGVSETEGIILSDPRKMAEVNARAKGEWQVTAAGLRSAQDAYNYRVIQMAYQAFWPQIYSAYRLSYQSGCQIVFPGGSGPGSLPRVLCYEQGNPRTPPTGRIGDWRYVNTRPPMTPQSLVRADQIQCAAYAPYFRGALQGNLKIYADADPGTPAGMGRGTEYRPQTGVARAGANPTYSVYVMAKTKDPLSVADMKVVEPFFRQTTNPNPNAAGFYAPLFWQQNLARTKRVQCQDALVTRQNQLRNVVVTNSAGGNTVRNNFYSNLLPTDIWPTPPR